MNEHRMIEAREEVIHARRELEQYDRNTRDLVGPWMDKGLVPCTFVALLAINVPIHLGWLSPSWRGPLTAVVVLVNMVALVRFLGARRLRRRLEHLERLPQTAPGVGDEAKIVNIDDWRGPDQS